MSLEGNSKTQTIVVGLGAVLCVWGDVNLLEGYG
ncbi:Maff2 family mobile element protein [Neglectibacter timonensis]|uniref:Maff2 family protein n=1 Tax=Neglectibacter timonensis TaxID=1776382 RepID=A0ABT1S0V1_9FIRM|nr:Maff2 family protein [Neglectibacter timonensis]MCQ4840556.1 Maff2 family protein [Neglectibacter timonensis]MCQ4844053.1 Maff2 family protein [Neglectibacter timonensis]MEE0730426.1 Maff2 family protein [Oscillospiraceae bacterium]